MKLKLSVSLLPLVPLRSFLPIFFGQYYIHYIIRSVGKAVPVDRVPAIKKMTSHMHGLPREITGTSANAN